MRISLNSGSSSSSLGFYFSVAISLLFLLIGGGITGYAALQYLDGVPLQENLPFFGVGLFMMVMSVVGLWRAWVGRQRADHLADLKEKYADALWKVRPEWRNSTIEETTKSATSLIVFAVIWNGFSWPLAGYVMYDIFVQSPDPQWGGLFVLVFPLAGLGIAWLAARRIMHRRKYGTSTLQMESMPGRLGQWLQARLQTNIAPDAAPEDGFHVRLTCYHRYVRYTRDSDGDRRKEVEKDLRWRDEKRVKGQARGADGVEIPISFELPTDQPPSTPEKREERMMWVVEVSADVPGLDYDTEFEVPVFEPDETSTESSSASTESEASGRSSDEVFWDMDESDEGTLQRESENDVSADQEAPDPYAEYEVGNEFTEPVSEGITLEQVGSSGLRLHFAAGRNKKSAVLLTVLGLVGLVGGFFLFASSFFAGLIVFGMGALLSYGAWYQWTNESTLTIADGQVRVGSRAKDATTFPCAHLADVRVEANGRMGESTLYQLNLYRMDAQAREKAAKGAEKMGQVVDFLQGTGLAGRGVDSEDMEQTIRQQVEKHGAQVKVAGGLTNKQEADWLAEQIKAAAERESQFA